MRLTLRTLLSYLDDVLEEPSRTELRRQIESSEHAGEWVHRTRDVMRRLRLGAPEIDGTGSADDPNTVAEYLDRTLPEQSVAEFERVCLESDAMLAEVASCHHVLAMFLHEAAEIDPDTRRRLHRLQTDLAEALQSRPASMPTPPGDDGQNAPPAEPPTAEEDHHGVPDYLKSATRKEWVRWAPAIAALLLLAVTSLIAFGPGGPLRRQAARDAEEAPVVAPAETPAEAEDAPAGESAPVGEEQSADPEAAAADDTTEPAAADAGDAAVGAGAPSEATDEAPSDAASEPVAQPEMQPPAPPQPPTEEPAVEPVEPAAVPADGAEAVAGEGEDAEPMAPEVVAPAFVGAETVLVVSAAEGDAPGWRRVMPGEELPGTNRLVVAPGYRAPFTLGIGVRALVVGPADVVVTASETDRLFPIVEVRYGRVLLESQLVEGDPELLQVIVDGVPHNAALGPEARLAIEVDRYFQPGWPLATTPTPVVAVANALAGSVEWNTRGEEIRIAKPKRWYVVEPGEATPPEGFGETGWVERSGLSEIEQRAADEIALAVDPGGPVWPQLREIAERDRFRENRAQAAVSSLVLGHPDTLIESFRDPERRAEWAENLARVRHAASRSPAVAAAVQQTLVEKFGAQKAAELMELVIGFTPEEFGQTPEEMSQGVATELLLPALGSDDLATRVLGGLVLAELVEPLDRPFRPLDSERRRVSAIRRLETMMERGELLPRSS